MAGVYAPRWMSGEEALEHLSKVEPDLHKQIALLQAVVRDGVVPGRKQGIDQERRWRQSQGLVWDPDDIAADEAWRRLFIDRDAASVNPSEFAANSEFLREDVLRVWPEADAGAKDTNSQEGAPLDGVKTSDGRVAVPHKELVAFFREHYGAPGAATNREDMARAAQRHFGGFIGVKALAAARQEAGVKGKIGRPRKLGK